MGRPRHLKDARIAHAGPAHADATSTSTSRLSAAQTREQQERFAQLLISGLSPEAAAKQMFPELKTPKTRGASWLNKPYVQQLIRDHQARVAQELEAKYAITRENVLAALSNLVFADPRLLFTPEGKLKNIVDLDDRTAKMVSSFEVFEETDREGNLLGYTKKIKMWDKNSAVDKAMRHLGLFEKDNEQARDNKIVLTEKDAGVL